MEPCAWHTNKELFGKKRRGGGGGGGSGRDSGNLIGGTSFPLATLLWLQ